MIMPEISPDRKGAASCEIPNLSSFEHAARYIAQRFQLTPSTAATIAYLAGYGDAEARQ